MKKKYSFIAVLLIAVILVFGCLFFQNRSHEEKEEKKTLRVGVTLFLPSPLRYTTFPISCIPLLIISAERWRRRRKPMRRRPASK